MLIIISWLALLAIGTFFVIRNIVKCKHPFRMALKVSLSGLASLMLVNVLASLTGVALAINYMTVSCAVVLGIPGTIMLLVMKLFG